MEKWKIFSRKKSVRKQHKFIKTQEIFMQVNPIRHWTTESLKKSLTFLTFSCSYFLVVTRGKQKSFFAKNFLFVFAKNRLSFLAQKICSPLFSVIPAIDLLLPPFNSASAGQFCPNSRNPADIFLPGLLPTIERDRWPKRPGTLLSKPNPLSFPCQNVTNLLASWLAPCAKKLSRFSS